MSTSRRLTALAFAAALELAAAAPAEAARPLGRGASVAVLGGATTGEASGLTGWVARLWNRFVSLFGEENGGNIPVTPTTDEENGGNIPRP